MEEKVWQLFELTGDIKYYMMYKELERADDQNANRENERNSNN